MKYQITVVVDADKTSEAVLKAETIGEVLSAQQARPTPQPQTQQRTSGLFPAQVVR